MNFRSARNFLAALLRWMRQFLGWLGPNQGQAPQKQAFGLAESPRDAWMRKYKTSSPPEDWLRRVAAAKEAISARVPPTKENVSSRIARSAEKRSRERWQEKEAALPKAPGESARARGFSEKPAEKEAKPAVSNTRRGGPAPAAPGPQHSRAEAAQSNEILARSRW